MNSPTSLLALETTGETSTEQTSIGTPVKKTSNDWIPNCEKSLKPVVGMIFKSIEKVEAFYKKYAHHVGFSVRVASEKKNMYGVKIWKYFLCYKEGYYRKKIDKEKDKPEDLCKSKIKARKFMREGCNARLVVKLNQEGKYVVFKFHEGHSHMLATPRKRQFLRSRRKLSEVYKQLFCAYHRANVGPSQSFHLIKEQVGGYENVGCTMRDLRNYHRDLKALVKDSDAHIFIDNLERKKSMNPSFYYAYKLDDEDRLEHVFWADCFCRKNYALFGDVVSFDTTYRTNKYSMIFAPFTGINNHRLLITFGAVLLGDEKVESFIWLFEHFLEAMRGHEPYFIITDQDPAIKIAISRTFKSSVHRFCMWHILKKVSEKVGTTLNSCPEFNNSLQSCVWKSETPKEFESTWMSMLTEFSLEKHVWLNNIFDIRHMWIPAYFRDAFMGGIMRTTSMSESEHSFFGRLLNKGLSLLEFWVRFDSLLQAQRYNKLTEENNMCTFTPELKTPLYMEKHARDIYTQKIFYIFQEELWYACMKCGIHELRDENGLSIFTIMENSDIHAKLKDVRYSDNEKLAYCSCKKFESEGIPCCHILFVLKGKGIDKIPNFYIVNRWTKISYRKSTLEDVNSTNVLYKEESIKLLVSEVWSQLFKCMHVAGKTEEKLLLILKEGENLEKELLKMKGDTVNVTTQLEPYVDSVVLDCIEIHPPKHSSTKGNGTRFKGGKERAMERQKRLRLCRAYGKHASHDSRNCPTKIDQ